MIPLIDVVFLLLTAFIYTAVTMVVARGIEIELPAASPGEEVEEGAWVAALEPQLSYFSPLPF